MMKAFMLKVFSSSNGECSANEHTIHIPNIEPLEFFFIAYSMRKKNKQKNNLF